MSTNTVSIGSWKRGLHTTELEKHRGMLDRLAKENNLDPTVLYAMANIESGFKEGVSNTNYGGLFAINKEQHKGKWQDPEYNTREAIKLYRSNERTWQNRFGKDDQFTPGKAYLLHQQGPGGGTALYAARNTDKSAAEVLAPFYKKAAAKVGMTPENYVRQHVIKSNGANPNVSARDFANMWMNRADALHSAYSGKTWTPAVESTASMEVAGDEAPKSIISPTRQGVWVEIKPKLEESHRQNKITLWGKIKNLFRKTS